MCTVWAALFLFLSPFPFRYRFAALRSAPPSPLSQPIPLFYPSVPFLVSQPRSLFLPSLSPHPPPPALPPAPIARASLRSSFPRLSVFVCPSLARRVPFLLLSLRLSRSRFFSRFFHRPRPPRPPRFFLSLMPLSTVPLPFVYYHQLLSFNPFLPRRAFYLSFSLSSLSFPLTLSLHVPPPPFS